MAKMIQNNTYLLYRSLSSPPQPTKSLVWNPPTASKSALRTLDWPAEMLPDVSLVTLNVHRNELASEFLSSNLLVKCLLQI